MRLYDQSRFQRLRQVHALLPDIAWGDGNDWRPRFDSQQGQQGQA